MTVRRVLTVMFDLAMLAASLRAGGPMADGVRAIGLIVLSILGVLVMFVTAVLAVALLDQRRPPYLMG
jgi:hypothetical protein